MSLLLAGKIGSFFLRVVVVVPVEDTDVISKEIIATMVALVGSAMLYRRAARDDWHIVGPSLRGSLVCGVAKGEVI